MHANGDEGEEHGCRCAAPDSDEEKIVVERDPLGGVASLRDSRFRQMRFDNHGVSMARDDAFTKMADFVPERNVFAGGEFSGDRGAEFRAIAAENGVAAASAKKNGPTFTGTEAEIFVGAWADKFERERAQRRANDAVAEIHR